MGKSRAFIWWRWVLFVVADTPKLMSVLAVPASVALSLTCVLIQVGLSVCISGMQVKEVYIQITSNDSHSDRSVRLWNGHISLDFGQSELIEDFIFLSTRPSSIHFCRRLPHKFIPRYHYAGRVPVTTPGYRNLYALPKPCNVSTNPRNMLAAQPSEHCLKTQRQNQVQDQMTHPHYQLSKTTHCAKSFDRPLYWRCRKVCAAQYSLEILRMMQFVKDEVAE